jgi:lipopolysaccharide transport system permease protein/teichoic acid transport system permease protein
MGAAWVILEPLFFIGILWFVFSVGFRRGRMNGIPFVVFLSSGLICWQYFSSTFMTNTNIIKRYSFLVKKVNFTLSILPVVRIFVDFFPHILLVMIVIIIASLNHIYPTLYLLQILYYFTAMFFLLLGLGWLTSALNVFVGDIGKIVKVLVQFGFWVTPIIWDYRPLSPKYQLILKLNPMFYIVEGYRDSIIYNVPFWEKPLLTLYFWGFTSFILLMGAIVFKRLRPHFASVI